MSNINKLYRFILDTNNLHFNKKNYINLKEKNNIFFSKYIIENISYNNHIRKNYLKSFSYLIRKMSYIYELSILKSFFLIRLLTIISLTSDLARAVLDMSRNKLNSSKVVKNQVLFLCIKFPYHAFNLNKNFKSSFLSSLKNSFQKLKIISIDNYILRKKTLNKKCRTKNVIFKKINFSFSNFLKILFLTFSEVKKICINENLELEFIIITLINRLKVNKVKNICIDFNDNNANKIKGVFFKGYENPFNYNEKINDINIYEFFYSDNCFVPPLNSLKNFKNLGKIINPNLWSLSNHHCGLTKFYDKIEKFKTKKLKLHEENNNKKIQLSSCMLGYSKNQKTVRKKSVLILDIPPILKKLERSNKSIITYDFSTSEDFCNTFIKDIIYVANLVNLNFYIKPKYNLSNYEKEYVNNFKYFSNKNLLLDPYDSISETLNDFLFTISAPYSSLTRIFNNNGFYYVPYDYKDVVYKDSKLIIGKDNLLRFINKKCKFIS